MKRGHTMHKKHTIKLYNDYEIPGVAFGTGVVKRFYRNKSLYFKDCFISFLKSVKHLKIDRKLKNDLNIYKIINNAIDNGYIFFDTGRLYGHSEKVIGRVISKQDRDKIFILTKVSDVDLERYSYARSVKRNLDISLNNLGTDYVDAYLLHFPQGNWIDMYKEIEYEYKNGRTRAIGVCNFDIEELEKLRKSTEIMPMICQVEIHPLCTKKELIEYCRRENIVIMAHSPIGHMNKKIIDSEVFKSLTAKYKKNPAQIMYKWHIQNGVIPIISTVSMQHMKENMDINDFELTDLEMQAIDSLNENFSFDKNSNKENDCPEFIYNV